MILEVKPQVRLSAAVGASPGEAKSRHFQDSRRWIADRLLDAEGVAVLPCDGFGPSGVGYLRLSLSASLDVPEDACDRIERFLGGLNR